MTHPVVDRGPTRIVDVAVIGDGPAGSALARRCRARDLDVAVIGTDEPWTATYATWVHDLADLDDFSDGPIEPLLAATCDTVWVRGRRTHQLSCSYGVFDNDALRKRLRRDVEHIDARVESVEPTRVDGRHRLALTDGSGLVARVVVDSAGWPPRFAGHPSSSPTAWQTAFGVVLGEPPAGDLGRATLMDFRAVVTSGTRERSTPATPDGPVTFCYSVPVADGWLVEETVLASRHIVDPAMLLPRLAARLGRTADELLAAAVRTESVRIPMGASLPDRRSPIVAFGAAAGYVHPATGFSVASSLRAASRVAAAIDRELSASASRPIDIAAIGESVWPRAARRSRVLHDYGLAVMVALDADELRGFFDAFFELPAERWSAYLRIDTPPGELARVMAQMFRSADGRLRRRLLAANPAAFARLLRP